jgi:zinc ribbon protein
MLPHRIGYKLKRCPHCAERVKAGAVVCRYCGKELPEVRQSVSKTPSQPPMEVWSAPPLSKRTKIVLGCLVAFAVLIFGVLVIFSDRSSAIGNLMSNRARPALSSETAPLPTASASETVQMESPSIVSAAEKLSPKSSLTTSPSTEFIRLLKPVTVQGAYGAITLQAGTSVPFVSRDGDNVRFHYHNTEYEIPVDTTDLAK